MKIETTPREDHQVTMTVELEQDKMEGAKRRAARQLAKHGKIAGFRPGKAPYEIILRQYGDEAITKGAVDILLEEIYPKALEEAKLEPGAQGFLEKTESLEPPKFIFTIPLRPEIDLGEYRKIRMAYKFKEPSEAELDAKLEELRRRYTSTEEVERPIEIGDYIKADIIGKVDDKVVFEKKEQPIFIKEKVSETEEPFLGFSKKLIGTSVGEKKTTTKTHPKDDANEDLRGLKVKYETTIKVVHGSVTPELDDDFAEKLGVSSMDELRKTIQESLLDESRSEYDDEYFTALIDKIKEGATIKYPPQVLDREIEAVIADISQRLSQQGMEFEAYLKMKESDLEKFTEEEARPTAKKRWERKMIFDELAELEKLEIAEDVFKVEFNQTIMNLASQGITLDNVKGGARAQKEIANDVAQQTAAHLMTRMILNRMKDIATGDFEKAKKAAAKAEKEASEPKEEKVEKTDLAEVETLAEKPEDNQEEAGE